MAKRVKALYRDEKGRFTSKDKAKSTEYKVEGVKGTIREPERYTEPNKRITTTYRDSSGKFISKQKYEALKDAGKRANKTTEVRYFDEKGRRVSGQKVRASRAITEYKGERKKVKDFKGEEFDFSVFEESVIQSQVDIFELDTIILEISGEQIELSATEENIKLAQALLAQEGKERSARKDSDESDDDTEGDNYFIASAYIGGSSILVVF